MKDCCGGGRVLIYSCSGGSDVGEISDKVSRKLSKEGIGKMTCLAGIGAGISGFIESAKGTDVNITIDGCKVQCAKRSLEKLGIIHKEFILTELGLEKNNTQVSEDVVEIVCDKIKKVLGIEGKTSNKEEGESCCC